MANDISPKNFKKSVESMKLNLLKTLFNKEFDSIILGSDITARKGVMDATPKTSKIAINIAISNTNKPCFFSPEDKREMIFLIKGILESEIRLIRFKDGF